MKASFNIPENRLRLVADEDDNGKFRLKKLFNWSSWCHLTEAVILMDSSGSFYIWIDHFSSEAKHTALKQTKVKWTNLTYNEMNRNEMSGF